LSVADHSQLAHYAGGLSLDEITEQHRDADRLNKRYGILKGIEADILGNGSLLGTFDFVVASVHSRFKMPKKNKPSELSKRSKIPIRLSWGT
jgi:DNA polymerase (family 10)